MLDVFDVSRKELQRAEILDDVKAGRLSLKEAAERMGITRQHAGILFRAYRQDGIEALRSKKRGRPSNRALPARVRDYALMLIRDHYADFGPTLAAEMLAERHGLVLSRETLRKWMIEDGLWRTRASRRRIHQDRPRRERFGELVQIDGSHHRWLEDRGPPCTLIVFIDDATGRLVELRFCQSETTIDYFLAAKRYMERYGKPCAFYSDKHGIFRPTHQTSVGGVNQTQFGRALEELNIDIICADTPQAKGRVERANRTLQDRLIKELRLAGISDIDEADRFAQGYIDRFNTAFAKPARSPFDAHRPLDRNVRLDHAFCVKNTRRVSQSLTLQYNKVRFLLTESPLSLRAIGRDVTVYDYPDGRLEIRYQGALLAYRTFDTLRRVNRPELVENKRLGAALETIMRMQAERDAENPPARNRRSLSRRAQTGHMFTEGVQPMRRQTDDLLRAHAAPERLSACEPPAAPLPACAPHMPEIDTGWEQHHPGQGAPLPGPDELARASEAVRKVSRAMTVNHRGKRYRLSWPHPEQLIGAKVLIREFPDGRVEIYNKSHALPWKRRFAYSVLEDDGRSFVYSRVGELTGE